MGVKYFNLICEFNYSPQSKNGLPHFGFDWALRILIWNYELKLVN